MARLFDIDKNKIVLNSDILAIPALKVIWDRDKSKVKDKAMKELSYIVFLCDFHSPYKDLKSNDKEELIIQDIFNNKKWKPDNEIKEAIKVYNKLQITPSMRMLQSAKVAIEKVADWFEKVDLEELDSYGKFKYSANDVSRNLKEIGNIVKSINNLEKQVRSELTESNARGNNIIGPFEEPDDTDEIDSTFEAD
jgi:hypothetical protein